MIPKPYDWEGTLTNTHPIALIETAQKILSKVLSNKISLSHLLNSLVRIKMCSHFINFFGNIHKGRINWVMTDFGLTDDYVVHNGFNQEEVKKHEHLYSYRMCSKFFTRTDKPDPKSNLTFFFAAGAFVDNTIWVGNCLTAIQNILNIASEFFAINDILINTEKTIAIPINQGAWDAVLSISGSRISVARKYESHKYLGIFLSTNDLSKPSLAKAYVDVKFFTNVVLRKTITEKQFLYLVSAVVIDNTVLQPIVDYRLQFSFASKSVCEKWNRLLRKRLKFKANLPKDFPSKVLHHLEFYEMKTFEQVLTQNLLANLINFANAGRILGRFFDYRVMDLQVASWTPQYSLHFPIMLPISPLDCFLAGTTHALISCNLFLDGAISNVFQAGSGILILNMLGLDVYMSVVKFFKRYGFVFVNQILNQERACFTWDTFCKWKRLDPRSPISAWFMFLSDFVRNSGLDGSMALVSHYTCANMSCEVSFIFECIFASDSGPIEIYTNSSVKGMGTIGICGSAAAYFPAADVSIWMKVHGLLSLTLVELQAITLALECVLAYSAVTLYMDSQASLDICKLA
ncbi:hypothetical protein G9A89_021492 [Geosiphon pyriformis]|nr:hypothetical protein G9A89_021492 [Geosiphon pyriformis]